MLNMKQEKFIQNIINGMSQRQAYKEAYGVNYSDAAIDTKASALFNTDKVQNRYKELLKKIEDESIMTASERMKWLTDIIKDGKLDFDMDGYKPIDINAKLKAMDILNKMSGEYVTKFEGNVSVEKLEDLL